MHTLSRTHTHTHTHTHSLTHTGARGRRCALEGTHNLLVNHMGTHTHSHTRRGKRKALRPKGFDDLYVDSRSIMKREKRRRGEYEEDADYDGGAAVCAGMVTRGRVLREAKIKKERALRLSFHYHRLPHPTLSQVGASVNLPLSH